MKRKLIRLLCVMLSLCCCTALADVELSNETHVYSGSSTIILNVPTSYTLSFECGDHGCVMVDGVVYRGNSTVVVPRLCTAVITIVPEDGYYADTVTASDNTGVTVAARSITISKVDRNFSFMLSFSKIVATGVSIHPDDVVLAPGMDVTLSAITVPEGAVVSWAIGDDGVATIDADGTVHAEGYGSTSVTATSGDASDTASVTVRDLQTMNFPTALVTVCDKAMMGNTAVENIVLSGNVSAIGDQAFANCTNLRYIRIPASVTSIGKDAFSGCEKLIILCEEGSTAHTYAQEHGIHFSLIK